MDRLKLDVDESSFHEQWKAQLLFVEKELELPQALLNQFWRRGTKTAFPGRLPPIQF